MSKLVRQWIVMSIVLTLLVVPCFAPAPVAAATDIVFQGFEGNDNWGYTASPAPYNTSGDVWDIVTDLGGITPATGTQFWGMQDLENPNGGGAFVHTLAFDVVDVSTHANAAISFAYNVIGFDSTDYLEYEIFFDGTGQGTVALFDGQTGGASTTGWETASVAVLANTTSVSLTLSARQNGSSDYAGFDDVRISVDLAGDVSVAKSAPSYVMAGDTLVYDLAVTAPATMAATGVVLTDTLPAGVTYVADNSGVTPSIPTAGVYVWNLGTVPSNTVQTVQLTVTVDSAVTNGTMLTNTVDVATDLPSDLTFNNTAQAATAVYTVQTIADVRIQFASGTLAKGDTVVVAGIATAQTGIYYGGSGSRKGYIQDATSGIQVRGSNAALPEVALGDSLQVVAHLDDYYGELQLAAQAAGDVTLTPGDITNVPSPLAIPMAVLTEPVEGLLVQITGQLVAIRSAGYGDQFFDMQDTRGNTAIVMVTDEAISDTTAIRVGEYYSMTGVVAYEHDEYRIKTRIPSDIIINRPATLLVSKSAPAKVLPGMVYDYNLAVSNFSPLTLTNLVLTDMFSITGATLADAGDAVVVGDTLSWTLTTLPSGTVWDVSFTITATGAPDDVIVNADYAVTADEWSVPVIGVAAETQITAGCSPTATAIYEIQGSGDTTPLSNQQVQACGIVVGVAPGLSGFFIQDLTGDDNIATSDGVFVYRGSQAFDIALGDVVEVSGQAKEYNDVTQVSASDSSNELTVLANDYPLPTSIALDPPADEATVDAYLEPVEGMLVSVPVTVNVIAPTNKYGEYSVIRGDKGISRLIRSENPPTGYRLTVDDGIVYGAYVAGDVLNGIYGPMHFTYGDWKIAQLHNPTVVSAAEIPAELPPYPTADAYEVTVGSLNVLNFDGDFAPDDYARKLEKVVANIIAMGAPTLLTLQEITVMDAWNLYDSITVTGVMSDLLASLEAEGVIYDYVASHPDGGGHGVAVLYKPNLFTLTGTDFPQGCSLAGSSGTSNYDHFCDDVANKPLFSRRPVVVSGTLDMTTPPTDITFIGVHLKSGFDTDDIQRRGEQASLLADYIAAVQTTGQENVMIAGDMNDFLGSGPLTSLQTTGTLTDTFYTLESMARYSYIYGGVSQVLDHILVSPALMERLTDFRPLHFNADYPGSWELATNPFAVSDHDPVVATLRLDEPAQLVIDKAIVSTSKTDNGTLLMEGALVTYTIVLSNVSTVDAQQVWLEDTLPTQVTFDGWVTNLGNAIESNDVITWTGTVSASTQLSLVFRVSIRPFAETVMMPIMNRVTFTADNADGGEDSVTFELEPLSIIFLPLVMRNGS